jgi:hypothetical protein
MLQAQVQVQTCGMKVGAYNSRTFINNGSQKHCNWARFG